MKSYTDLEMSKKLADILPLESADQTWARTAIVGANFDVPEEQQYRHNGDMPFQYYSGDMPFQYYSVIGIPCWSLATLLHLLPNEISSGEYKIRIRKYSRGNTTLYQVAYGNNKGHSGTWHDMINTGEKENLIDCCVSMIMVLRQFYESELNEAISNYEQSERPCHR